MPTMAHLEDLREELYRKGFKESPPPPRDVFPRKDGASPPPRWPGNETAGSSALPHQASLAARTKRRSAWRAIAVGGAVLILGIGGYIGYTLWLAPAEVLLSVSGPKGVSAGEIVALEFTIENRGRVPLAQGTLTVTFPSGSIPLDPPAEDASESLRRKIEVPGIPPGGIFTREVRLRLFGAVGERAGVSLFYLYRPENIQTRLSRTADATVEIVRVPVALSVDAPERLSSGQELTLAVAVDADQEFPFDDLALGMGFPPGFVLRSTDPPLKDTGEAIWPLGALASGDTRRFTIRGTVSGDPEEAKPFPVRLGRYDASAKTWRVFAETQAVPSIVPPLLYARTAVGGMREGALAPSSKLNGNVFFKNNLAQSIRDVSIRISFPEEFVRLETVRAERGFYDVTRRALVWNPASESRLSELAPGEEGTLAFSFELKDSFPFRGFADRNLVFPVTTTITSADSPPELRGVVLEYRDRVEFKIESRLLLSAHLTYYDSPVPNSGPLPPRIRQTTTYTLVLQLSSGTNAVRNVEVKGQLSGGVEWRGAPGDDAGAVSFNPESREFVWRIRELAPGTGALRPHAAAVMQLALTPAENQLHSSPALVRGLRASGEDAFTLTVLNDTVEDLTTELRQDSRSSSGEWRVAE